MNPRLAGPGAVLGVLLAVAAQAATPPEPDTSRVLRAVRALADPAWAGRGIGTAGIDSAAAWIAREMAAAGLRPGGASGTWLQPFEVTTGVELQEPCWLESAGRTDRAGEHLQPIGFSSNGRARAPVVFAGYGITAPGFGWDDYEGLDVRDKIVLVLSNEPGEMDSTSRFDGSVNTAYSELRTKAINAREHGAIGLLVAHGPQHHRGEPLRAPATDGAGYMTAGLLAAWISEEAANGLLARSGLDLAAAQTAIEAHAKPHSIALTDTVTLVLALKRTRSTTANVVGLIPGRDSTRTLVIGAHYDHLGMGGASSLDPESHRAHVGADDNASGVAAMLEAARALGARARRGWRPTSTLVFAAFSAEEIGLVGSSHFTDDPPRPIETITTMLNMDMVGRLREDKLSVMGVGTAVGFRELVARVNTALGGDSLSAVTPRRGATRGFHIRTSEDGYGPSDHGSFYRRDIPVLMLFTGAHADYHKPSDTWDKLHYRGLARISAFATMLVESLDARPRATFTKAKADVSPGRIAGGGGYGAYLGTIPDYMQTEGGVLLSGVRSGSPAEKAGLAARDVIVRFDGVRVDNIYDYTFALRTRKPGMDVRVTVLRGGQEVDLVATLGRRP